jgi:CspA family cold shock protein
MAVSLGFLPSARSDPLSMIENRCTLIGVHSKRASSSKGKSVNKGTVKFFNIQKGYGFISPDGGGNDVFVHVTALERAGIRNLAEGQKVRFDTETDRRTGKLAVSNIATD